MHGSVEVTEARNRLSWGVEAVLTVAALGVVLPLLLDAVTGSVHDLSLRIEHGLVLLARAPVAAAARFGLVDPGWRSWTDLLLPLSIVGFGAGFVTTLAALLDPPPGSPASRGRRVLATVFVAALGLPALLATLLGVVAGALLAPDVFLVCLGSASFGAILGARRRRAALPHERSLSGLPPALWMTDHLLRFAIVAAGFVVLYLVAVAAAARSDALLRSALVAIDQNGLLGPALLGNGVTMGTVLLLLAAPPTRRTLGTLTWEPWAGAGAGLLAMAGLLSADGGWWEIRVGAPMGFAAGLSGALLAAAGQPALPRLDANPVRAIGRLHAPVVAALMAGAYALSTGFLGCGTVLADSRIEVLSPTPGARAVAWTEGGLEATALATVPEEDMVTRVGVSSGVRAVIDLDRLPLDSLRLDPVAVGEGPRTSRRPEHVVPGPFGRTGDDRPLLAWSLSEGTAAGLLELDPSTGAVVGVTEVEGGCRPASYAWNPWLELGVTSCADKAELGLYEPTLGRYLTHVTLQSRAPLERIGVDPRTGEILGLPAGPSPFVLRVGPKTGRTLGWRFVGSPQADLAVDATGTLHIPRRLGRQVMSMDAQTLAPVHSGFAGFGVESVAVSRRHARVLAASALDGYLYASRPGTTGRVPRLRIGGGVHDLALSDDESTLLAAGFCGVLAIDLVRWLGD